MCELQRGAVRIWCLLLVWLCWVFHIVIAFIFICCFCSFLNPQGVTPQRRIMYIMYSLVYNSGGNGCFWIRMWSVSFVICEMYCLWGVSLLCIFFVLLWSLYVLLCFVCLYLGFWCGFGPCFTIRCVVSFWFLWFCVCCKNV